MGFHACSFCTHNCYIAHGHEHRQNPAPVLPAFYKIVLESVVTKKYSNQLRIPANFAKQHTKKLSATIILQGPSGQKWVAGLRTGRGGTIHEIARGWRAFSSNHKLAIGDLLIFNLIAESHFLVQIFDKHGCEKEASYEVENNSKPIDHSGLLNNNCELCERLKVDMNDKSDSMRTKEYDRSRLKASKKDCDCRFTNRPGKWPMKKCSTKVAPTVTVFPDLAERNASKSVPSNERKSPHSKPIARKTSYEKHVMSCNHDICRTDRFFSKEFRANQCKNLCSTPNLDTDKLTDKMTSKLRRTTKLRSEHRQLKKFKLSQDNFQPVQSVEAKPEEDKRKEIMKKPFAIASEDDAAARNKIALGKRLEQSLQYRVKMEQTQRTTSKKQTGKRKMDNTLPSSFEIAHCRKAYRVQELNVRELYRKTSSQKEICCMQNYPIDMHESPPSEASLDSANALNAALARTRIYPSVSKLMTKSQVQKGFWLGIPKDFALAWLPKMDACGTLVDTAGKKWAVKWFAKRNGLSAGWRKFSLDHYLKIGDTCVFELINKHKLLVKVHIFRARVADVDPDWMLPARKFAALKDIMKCSSVESLRRAQ